MRLRGSVAAVPLTLSVLVGGAACAPEEDEPSASESSASPASCAKGDLPLVKPGTLSIGTSSPAYPPWFSDNDPSNGKGYESAVAYAVADQLGFAPDEVTWLNVPFNNSYKPGPKNFDFDINQVSITPARAEVVDFSDGYYSAAQGVIALKDNPAADATGLDDLKGLKLGAQTGTTSLTAIREVIQPDQAPAVYPDTNAATQALKNGQVDAILADLPTAFIIAATELSNDGTVVGQFQPETGQQEEFGMLFEKGSGLVPCVNEALATLRDDGTLAELEKKWVSDVADVPVLQ
jgi:polar amino acid transport system substrate-binding protein